MSVNGLAKSHFFVHGPKVSQIWGSWDFKSGHEVSHVIIYSEGEGRQDAFVRYENDPSRVKVSNIRAEEQMACSIYRVGNVGIHKKASQRAVESIFI